MSIPCKFNRSCLILVCQVRGFNLKVGESPSGEFVTSSYNPSEKRCAFDEGGMYVMSAPQHLLSSQPLATIEFFSVSIYFFLREPDGNRSYTFGRGPKNG